MIARCEYAGTGCDDAVQYSMLGVLLGLTTLVFVYSLNEYRQSAKKSTSRNVLPMILTSEIFMVGTVISRFFLHPHTWPTSLLFIGVIASLYSMVFHHVVSLLLKPVRFLKFTFSKAYRLTNWTYWMLQLTAVAILVASNAQLSLGRDESYHELISVFFALFGILNVGFAVLLWWATRYLNKAMTRVNGQYDRFTKHAALQRRNLIINAQRLAMSVAFISVIIAGMALALCGIYFSLGATGITSSILWFFLMTAVVANQYVITMFFGDPVRIICPSRPPIFVSSVRSRNSSLRYHRRIRSSMRSSIVDDQASANAQTGDQGPYLENRVGKPNRDPIPDLLAARGSIYEKVGGRPMVERVVIIFYDKMVADPRVAGFFGNASMSLLKQKQEMFFILMMGGPAMYTGKSLRTAHAKLNLDEQSFDIAAMYMREAMQEVNMAPDDIDVVVARVAMFKNEILGLVGTAVDQEATGSSRRPSQFNSLRQSDLSRTGQQSGSSRQIEQSETTMKLRESPSSSGQMQRQSSSNGQNEQPGPSKQIVST